MTFILLLECLRVEASDQGWIKRREAPVYCLRKQGGWHFDGRSTARLYILYNVYMGKKSFLQIFVTCILNGIMIIHVSKLDSSCCCCCSTDCLRFPRKIIVVLDVLRCKQLRKGCAVRAQYNLLHAQYMTIIFPAYHWAFQRFHMHIMIIIHALHISAWKYILCNEMQYTCFFLIQHNHESEILWSQTKAYAFFSAHINYDIFFCHKPLLFPITLWVTCYLWKINLQLFSTQMVTCSSLIYFKGSSLIFSLSSQLGVIINSIYISGNTPSVS